MDLSKLNELDINSIDFNNPGKWPAAGKVAVAVLLVVAAAGAAVYFHHMPQWEQLEKLEATEDQLRGTFEEKQRKAANLEAFKKQLEEMELKFASMLRQLPGKTEVENLLDDISRTGLSAGLEFQLFRPGSEIRKAFYAELPISLKMTGGYHEFGAFASGVAALPRIVTLHEIKITGKGEELSMTAQAKTYRYLEEE